MRTAIINKRKVELYDSIDEMPIINFQKYNKYLLIDSGIGSDVDDIDRHISRIAKYLKMDDKAKALQELQNMRQSIYMVTSEISPKHLAFAALIKSVDGKEVTDLSDENLKVILADLNKERHSLITKIFLAIKKKVSEELEVYFPGDFTNAKANLIFNKQKERLRLTLDSVLQKANYDKEIESIDDSIIRLLAPKSFNGRSSVEIQYDKQFEETCLMLSQEGHVADPRKLTVLQFYGAVATIKKQADMKSKILKKHKVKRPKK